MKSGIYLVNSTDQTIADGDVIDLGYIVRRYGNMSSSGKYALVNGAGYYALDATVTFDITTTGEATVTAYKDGFPIEGATATVQATATEPITVPLMAMFRKTGCCYEPASRIYLVWSGGAATITDVDTRIIKL